MAHKLDNSQANFEKDFTTLLNLRRKLGDNVSEDVAAILQNVRVHGDKAVFDYAKKFDNFEGDDYRITPERMRKAFENCKREYLLILENAIDRVREFHEKTLPQGIHYHDEDDGLNLGIRYTAVESAGIYIPGGKASYPSSTYMGIVPAQIARVERIVAVVPNHQGDINPLVLAALHYLGIEEAYSLGGAHAIAALAYGTETIKPVNMIAGPGNIYVATAKKQLFGTVGIDMIAGPSELVVVGDETSNPEWGALDLLAQAEHDEMAQATVISTSQTYLDAVESMMMEKMKTLTRGEIIKQSWHNFGAIIKVKNLDEAAEIVNRIAPEHLEICLDAPYDFAYSIKNVGAMFLGKHTPCALGDYTAGPSHVLPTGGSAYFSSGLGTASFMKRSSIIESPPQSLAHLGLETATLAETEGLEAHQLSILARLGVAE